MDFRRHCGRRGPAFVEYGLAVPASRYGSNACSAGQPKAIQDAITLTMHVISEHRAWP
ncbi:MAG: DMT family protein [Xanthobacteraceae bacterium]